MVTETRVMSKHALGVALNSST